MGALTAEQPLVTTVAFAAIMGLAALLDLTSRRIPNALTVTAVALGLLLRVPLGLHAVIAGILGIGLALVLTTPLFLVGALGGGDAKLLAAVGAFMGPGRLIGACLLIALLGGVVAVLDAVRRGALLRVLLNTFHMVVGWLSPARSGVPTGISSPTAMTIPYGVPIAVGALGWWFWGGATV